MVTIKIYIILTGTVTEKMACNWDLELKRLKTGVNFTNILRAAFMLVDPESVKKYSKVISIFLCFRDLRA